MSKYNGGKLTQFWMDWAGFCDENKIDLVLTGDHHVYMRSHPMNDGVVAEEYGADYPDATVYITTDSADGDRGSLRDEVSKNGSRMWRQNTTELCMVTYRRILPLF